MYRPFSEGALGRNPAQQVAQLANFRGTIWATWDSQAPSFDEYLDDAKVGLNAGLRVWDGSDAPTELLRSPQEWLVPSNWKFISENFAGDMLHAVGHRPVEMVGIGPRPAKARRDNPGARMLSTYPRGHGFLFGVKPATEPRDDYATSPITAAYFQEWWQRRIKMTGERAGVMAYIGTVRPNMSFHPQRRAPSWSPIRAGQT